MGRGAQEFAKNPVKYGVKHSSVMKAGKDAYDNASASIKKFGDDRKKRLESKRFREAAEKNDLTRKFREEEARKKKDKNT